MKIYKNYDLSKLNTFGVSANAKFFVEIENEVDLKELFDAPEFLNSQKLFLGGGSNVLFTKDFDGIVVLNKLKGIKILKEDSETVTIRSMGGEMWHDLVTFVVGRGLWGIENLSLIPGTVGAAPMQNIGAYGVELKDVLENVEAFDIGTGEKKIFNRKECEFGYRDSVFKGKFKGKYFITAITLILSKIPKPNLSYKILSEFLEKPARNASHSDAGGNKIEIKSSKDISDAISAIRKSKLPDPKKLGNAGSFFKNVFVEPAEFKKLQKLFPEIPYFEEENEKNGSKASVLIKIPAGWLIEQCGWKGKRLGNVGVHEKQALVLVNYGGARGEEVMALANKIIADVKEKFDLELTPEVNLIR
ncbi:MAG: UDP-N-acetylmuramate dehydrogenase [Candidatus Nomurabacteria bacterium]|nr:UDP-N-acetylmuramate dehydrogenase [Candidatus Nomurabacteria bacterium]